MNYLATQIVSFITGQGVISDEADVQDFYIYGVEISISSFLNIFLVILVGVIINHFIESVIFLALFILIRSFTGGYHADTYFRCNLLMCTTFALTVIVNNMISSKLSLLMIIVLICITEIIVSVLGPIENKNKPIDDTKRTRLKIAGLIITLMINFIGVFLWENILGTMIVLTTFLIAILMIAAKIKEKRGDTHEKV